MQMTRKPRSQKPQRRCPVYHYTRLRLLLDMAKVGAIKPSAPAGSIPPFVWCSTAKIWEPIAHVSLDLNIPDVVALWGWAPGADADLPARIRVDRAGLLEWPDALLVRGVPFMDVFVLAQVGNEYGSNPRQWWVSPTPIPISAWSAVEVWLDGSWLNVGDIDLTTETTQAAEGRKTLCQSCLQESLTHKNPRCHYHRDSN